MYPSATVLRQNISRLIKDTEIQGLRAVEPVMNQSLEIQTRRENGRRERIRTSDPFVPNEVRYQAALHADQRPVLYGLPAVLLPHPWGKLSVQLRSRPSACGWQQGNVGYPQEQVAQAVKQGQAVVAHGLVVCHHHDFVKEGVYRLAQAGQGGQRAGVVALFEQRQYFLRLLFYPGGQVLFGGILQQ